LAEPDPGLDLLATIEAGTADRRILEFAARGFVPLSPAELVRAVASVVAARDPELCPLAEETFRTFDPETLAKAVKSPGVLGVELDVIARRTSEPHVLEPLIRSRAVPDETLAWLADRISPDLQDILITNQVRLLASPQIVERLFENPHLSADIRRRADEFLEEFFLKKLREESDAKLAEALEVDEAAERAEEEAKGREAEAAASPVIGPDGDLTEDATRSLFARMAGLNVVQRIRMAYKGSREERLFLVRDRNRLVSTAVLKSPKTAEADIESFANLKSVSEDILRLIGTNRQWTRKYSVVLALVRNPRSPVDVTMTLVNRLQAKDQKTLASDRNVPEVVRAFARRVVSRRQG
jgi:hypothetical protein